MAIAAYVGSSWRRKIKASAFVVNNWKTIHQVYAFVGNSWRPIWSYYWQVGAWGNCSKSCGGGIQTRSVVCMRNDGLQVDDIHCTLSAP